MRGAGVAALVAAIILGGMGAASAAGDSISIGTVNGIAANEPISLRAENPAMLKGTAALSPTGTAPSPVVADAGNSGFVEVGKSVRLSGAAAGGAAPYTFTWSAPAGNLTDAFGPAVTFDAAGVSPGVVDITLTVADSGGRMSTDTVKVLVYELSEQVVLEAQGSTLVGLPDDVFQEAGGNIDGQTTKHRFLVPVGSRDLSVTLDWGLAENDYDLIVHGEGTTGDTSGASGAKPEVVTEATPANAYVAQVNPFLTVPDNWSLLATALVPPADPRPQVLVPSPFRFEVGQPQTLRADVTGGDEPAVAWDLDGNGTYEAPGQVVTTEFPLGTHLVTVKVTDEQGYEARETVPVRVVPPGSQLGSSPIVVIAINDSGINPYHRDYSAATYPDRSILSATGDFTRHPSEYIPGYPADSEALPVTLGKGFLPAEDCPDGVVTVDTTGAFTIDGTCAGGLWNPERVEGGKLYWIPGTKIIGARSFGPDAHPILDDNGHGTGASSVSAGNTYGSCPSCLIVFEEGFGSDWAADQPWIDLVSNSYGNINLTPDLPVNPIGSIVDVKEAVERGQTWLFASGNGHTNTFTVPNTTYTQKHNGPDWILRVGAVDSGNRQALLGDGAPADVSSFGAGPLPSASAASDTAVDSFGGTSAATPVTSGVFGLVLGAARDALGDDRSGQRPNSAVAVGLPVAGSPYLGDGVLTRAELWELVLKTTQPGDYPATDVSLFSETYPLTQFHYLAGGYGIADQASAARAIDVMLGVAPLPDRSEEDAFFACDSALRVELYGSWSGYEEQYGASGCNGADVFAGVTTAQVDTLDGALGLLGASGALSPSSAEGATSTTVTSAGSSAVGGLPLLASPRDGATYDATVVREIAVAGNAGTRAGTETLRRYARRGGAAGECTGKEYLGTEPGTADPQCSFTAQTVSLAGQGFGDFENSYALEDQLPIVLDAHRPVTGTINIGGVSASPDTIVLVGLRTGGAIIGWQRISKPVVGNTTVPFDFSFPIAERFANVPLDRLELVVGLRRSAGAAREGLNAPTPSFVDLPLAPMGGRAVRVDVDGTAVGTYAVDERDGSWGENLELNTLATGKRNITATLLTDGVAGATQKATITVLRPVLARVVEVAFTRADGTLATAWTAGAFERKGTRWSAFVRQAPSSAGEYFLVARITQGGREVARSMPVPVTVSSR